MPSCMVVGTSVHQRGCFAVWRRVDGSVTLSFHWALLLWPAAPFPSPEVRELGLTSTVHIARLLAHLSPCSLALV